jgi:alpha-D-ribose 1-methylphosphonate 5-triphosphate synthase subunit PhnH
MIREINYDELFDAQQHFRLLLDAMARPGKLQLLNGDSLQPPASLNPAAAGIALALLNTDVRFYASSEPAAGYIRLNTDARPVNPEEADFLFIGGNERPDTLERAKTGQPAYPETGATLVIGVERLSLEPELNSVVIHLRGPGVPGQKDVFVQGLSTDILAAIREKNREYPLGVDVMLTDPAGLVCCVPRTNQFTWTVVG